MVRNMYIKVKNKEIEIQEKNTWMEKFKSLKFVLEPIDYGIKISKTRWINTYFFCQRVDICVTDKDNRVQKVYENVKSEKRIFLWKKYNIYYLPLNTIKNVSLNEKIKEINS